MNQVKGLVRRVRLPMVSYLVADDEALAFELYVHCSFAEHLWRWLIDAGTEYGVSVGGRTTAMGG